MIKNKTWNRKKIVTVFFICVAIFFVLTGRLIYLMVFQSDYYSEKADQLHERERGIKAARGRILDANGTVIADNRTVCTISVIHNQIKDPDAIVEVLSKELDLSEDYVRKRVEKYSSIERIKSNVDKEKGDSVSAATLNQSGFIKCEATGVGEDTTLSKIIQMVSDAAATKAPIAKVADKVSGVFVPAVIAVAAVTILVWLLAGKDIGFALARGISVLVISCPCALGLATPVAIMTAAGKGASLGILYKDAETLQKVCGINCVFLDKTATLTEGKPKVTDVEVFDCNREEINKLSQYQFKDYNEMLNYIKNELEDN